MLHCIYHHDKPAPEVHSTRLAILRDRHPFIIRPLRFSPTPKYRRSACALSRENRKHPLLPRESQRLIARQRLRFSGGYVTQIHQHLKRCVVLLYLYIVFSTERYAFNMLLAVRATCVQV